MHPIRDDRAIIIRQLILPVGVGVVIGDELQPGPQRACGIGKLLPARQVPAPVIVVYPRRARAASAGICRVIDRR